MGEAVLHCDHINVLPGDSLGRKTDLGFPSPLAERCSQQFTPCPGLPPLGWTPVPKLSPQHFSQETETGRPTSSRHQALSPSPVVLPVPVCLNKSLSRPSVLPEGTEQKYDKGATRSSATRGRYITTGERLWATRCKSSGLAGSCPRSHRYTDRSSL